MRILHAYCLNYNVGDYALGFGVKNILRKHLNVDLIGQTNLQGREFHRYYISEVVNKRYDLLVVGGGGIIHGAHWPQGWFWLIEKELLGLLEIPFIVYGAGFNYFDGETGIPQRGVEHLHETFRRAAYFSVRNDGSARRLASATGIEANVTPDPGFHVPLGSDWGPRLPGDFVVVQVAGDKPDLRYGSREERLRFVGQLRGVLTKLSKRYRIVAIPHVLDDVELSREVTRGIANSEVIEFGSFAFDRCGELMKYYRDARLVLAMRGHGQIVPIGFGTPVATFSAHEKVGGMMATLGLQEFHADLKSRDFGEELLTVVERIEKDEVDLRQRLGCLTSALEEETARQMRQVRRAVGCDVQ